jgi:uncharacterized caspase-like protein
VAAAIGPRDAFVFFAAAHSYSYQGRFYLIPQDYQGGTNPEALQKLALDQARLQDWFANRIKSKKALILLDTCESGALTNGYSHSGLSSLVQSQKRSAHTRRAAYSGRSRTRAD